MNISGLLSKQPDAPLLHWLPKPSLSIRSFQSLKQSKKRLPKGAKSYQCHEVLAAVRSLAKHFMECGLILPQSHVIFTSQLTINAIVTLLSLIHLGCQIRVSSPMPRQEELEFGSILVMDAQTDALGDNVDKIVFDGSLSNYSVSKCGTATQLHSIKDIDLLANSDLDVPNQVDYSMWASLAVGTSDAPLISWTDTMRAMADAREAWKLGSKGTALLWLPLDQPLQLFAGLLLPLFIGYDIVLFRSKNCIESPTLWNRVCSTLKISLTVAPEPALQQAQIFNSHYRFYNLCVIATGTWKRGLLQVFEGHEHEATKVKGMTLYAPLQPEEDVCGQMLPLTWGLSPEEAFPEKQDKGLWNNGVPFGPVINIMNICYPMAPRNNKRIISHLTCDGIPSNMSIVLNTDTRDVHVIESLKEDIDSIQFIHPRVVPHKGSTLIHDASKFPYRVPPGRIQEVDLVINFRPPINLEQGNFENENEFCLTESGVIAAMKYVLLKEAGTVLVNILHEAKASLQIERCADGDSSDLSMLDLIRYVLTTCLRPVTVDYPFTSTLARKFSPVCDSYESSSCGGTPDTLELVPRIQKLSTPLANLLRRLANSAPVRVEGLQIDERDQSVQFDHVHFQLSNDTNSHAPADDPSEFKIRRDVHINNTSFYSQVWASSIATLYDEMNLLCLGYLPLGMSSIGNLLLHQGLPLNKTGYFEMELSIKPQQTPTPEMISYLINGSISLPITGKVLSWDRALVAYVRPPASSSFVNRSLSVFASIPLPISMSKHPSSRPVAGVTFAADDEFVRHWFIDRNYPIISFRDIRLLGQNQKVCCIITEQGIETATKMDVLYHSTTSVVLYDQSGINAMFGMLDKYQELKNSNLFGVTQLDHLRCWESSLLDPFIGPRGDTSRVFQILLEDTKVLYIWCEERRQMRSIKHECLVQGMPQCLLEGDHGSSVGAGRRTGVREVISVATTQTGSYMGLGGPHMPDSLVKSVLVGSSWIPIQSMGQQLYKETFDLNTALLNHNITDDPLPDTMRAFSLVYHLPDTHGFSDDDNRWFHHCVSAFNLVNEASSTALPLFISGETYATQQLSHDHQIVHMAIDLVSASVGTSQRHYPTLASNKLQKGFKLIRVRLIHERCRLENYGYMDFCHVSDILLSCKASSFMYQGDCLIDLPSSLLMCEQIKVTSLARLIEAMGGDIASCSNETYLGHRYWLPMSITHSRDCLRLVKHSKYPNTISINGSSDPVTYARMKQILFSAVSLTPGYPMVITSTDDATSSILLSCLREVSVTLSCDATLVVPRIILLNNLVASLSPFERTVFDYNMRGINAILKNYRSMYERVPTRVQSMSKHGIHAMGYILARLNDYLPVETHHTRLLCLIQLWSLRAFTGCELVLKTAWDITNSPLEVRQTMGNLEQTNMAMYFKNKLSGLFSIDKQRTVRDVIGRVTQSLIPFRRYYESSAPKATQCESNPFLLYRVENALNPRAVWSTEAGGIDIDWLHLIFSTHRAVEYIEH